MRPVSSFPRGRRRHFRSRCLQPFRQIAHPRQRFGTGEWAIWSCRRKSKSGHRDLSRPITASLLSLRAQSRGPRFISSPWSKASFPFPASPAVSTDRASAPAFRHRRMGHMVLPAEIEKWSSRSIPSDHCLALEPSGAKPWAAFHLFPLVESVISVPGVSSRFDRSRIRAGVSACGESAMWSCRRKSKSGHCRSRKSRLISSPRSVASFPFPVSPAVLTDRASPPAFRLAENGPYGLPAEIEKWSSRSIPSDHCPALERTGAKRCAPFHLFPVVEGVISVPGVSSRFDRSRIRASVSASGEWAIWSCRRKSINSGRNRMLESSSVFVPAT